jgi:nitroimidazol reductase NimA-like FMN-containing flavoprotein (pyridoxamine 5'-phosphate oxidase superfamily)
MTERADVPENLRIKREPQRGVYDRATIDAILDEALLCHLGFEVDGQPYVIPTLHARIGDRLYVHGSAASRMLRHAASGVRVCVTVTLLDGIVLARSVFNHSINYRSVVVLGTATKVEGAEKTDALRAFTDHIAPGRWDEARQPTEQELKATWVLSLPLTEASAKVRSGPPEDDAEDLDFPVWSGVVPVHLAAEPSEYSWQRVRDSRVVAP